MSRSRFFALSSIVLAGSFAGGYVANRIIPIAHAQTIPSTNDVRGTSFTLVDASGKVQATLRGGPMGAGLILNGGTGNARVEISAGGGIVVRDQNGRVAWRSPRTALELLGGHEGDDVQR